MSNASHLTKVTTPNTNVGTRGSTCADLFARTALVTAMIMAGVANAQTWTGATDTDWNTASNWTGGTPAAADDAVINTGTGNQPTLGVTTPGLTSTSVSAGTLAISNSGNLVSTDVNISGSGAIENAGVITGAVSVSDTGTLTNNGGTLSGPLTLNNSGSFRATTSGTIGNLRIGSSAAATISAATGTTLTQTGAFNSYVPSGSVTFGSAIDTGRVVMTANGGAYGLNFSVNVAGGTLAAAGSQFAGLLSNISSTSVAAGATLDIGSIDTTVQRLGGAGTVTNSSATDRVLTLKNTSTFAGAISDGATNNLSLVRIGTGTTTLTGASGYTGSTTVAQGTLALGAGSSLASTSVTIDAGAVLSTNGEHLADGTTLSNNGQFTVTGAETIGEMNGTGAVTLTDPGVLTIAGAATATISNAFNGSGGLTFTNAGGAHTLNGTNSHTGATTLEAGGLTLSGGSAIADTGAVVVNGGILALSNSETIGALSGTGGAIQLGSNTLTVNATNGSSGYDGAIGGTGGISKTGAGTLALSGTNTYSGGTTIDGGTISISAYNNLGTGALTLDGGTLQTTSSFTSSRSTTLNAGGGTFNTGAGTTLTQSGQISGAGSMEKIGTGALLLTGNNTYTGSTQLSGGNLTLSGAGALASTDVTISAGGTLTTQGGATTGLASATALLNNGLLALTGDEEIGSLAGAGAVDLGAQTLTTGGLNTDTTFAGVVSGVGSLQKVGTGTLLLSGVNTYSGGTTVSAGTLQGNSTSLQGDILNNATVSFDQAVNGTYAGAMTGSGSLIKSSAGTLLLSGANTYNGGTTVSAGTLQGNSTSLQGDILNNAMVSFDQAADGVYAGAMSGTGGFIKSGAGRLTFSGGNTYTGNTTINDGTLAVNGSLAGDVQVNNGGRLQGTGSVGSVTLVSGGVYAPGNSIGTQVVNGDLAFNGGSIYEVETDPTGAGSDLIQVNGVATLAGQVQHIGESGTYRPLSTYTILSATGGFAGTTFEGATSDYAFLTPTLTYDLNNVYLGLLRNDVAVADFGQTSNQIATASALDSLPTGGALQIAILGLTNNEVPGALNALSGELYASANSAVLQNSQEFSQSLLQRSGNQLDEYKRTALPLWIETESATRRNEGDSNTAEAIQRDSSVAVGGELAMPNDWILGVAFRYGDQRLSVDDRSSHADIDSYSFGLYGRWAQPLDAGVLRMTLGGIYGIHSIDAERDIYTTGMRQSLSADYDATSRQVFAELGYAMDLRANIQLEPYVGISWTQVANDSFTEKGGNAALHGDSQNEDMTASTLGLRSQLPLSNGQFQLDAGLGWQHNFSDVNPEADLNFAGSSTFTVEGAALARDTAMLDLGASYRITPAITVRAGYSGQFGDNVSSNGGNLTFTWEL